MMGFEGRLYQTSWPVYEEAKTVESVIEIAVQINGKVRTRLMIAADMTREQAEAELPQLDEVKALVGDKTIAKVIFVPGRLCNLIVK